MSTTELIDRSRKVHAVQGGQDRTLCGRPVQATANYVIVLPGEYAAQHGITCRLCIGRMR